MNTLTRFASCALVLINLSACTTVTTSPPESASASVITPAAQLQKPAAILEAMNRNYNEATTDCREAGSNERRGTYYCSGVLLRTVDDGAFTPWSYSPSAVTLGATSYSWIRQDVPTTQLYNRAGFILRNRVEAMANGLPGLETGFICIYPFNAGTVSNLNHNGCGLRTLRTGFEQKAERNNNSAYAWGSCEAAGITTEAQWDQYYTQNGKRQCSWGMENQTGWKAVVSTMNRYGTRAHNEIMLKNYNNGEAMPRYIAAFFYDINRAGSLADAQSFQRKLNAAGYNVPILRLDFTAAKANRFAYAVADQAVPQ
ncbi:hypothetical protein LZ023_33645 [Pseudomonas silvicola]|nr:hypothetical protein LZ023_33645 [Pseudomonas silvicola]